MLTSLNKVDFILDKVLITNPLKSFTRGFLREVYSRKNLYAGVSLNSKIE